MKFKFTLRTIVVGTVLAVIGVGAVWYRSGNVEAKLSARHDNRTPPPGRLISDAATCVARSPP